MITAVEKGVLDGGENRDMFWTYVAVGDMVDWVVEAAAEIIVENWVVSEKGS